MKDGFIKIAAGTPEIKVADCRYNKESIVAMVKQAAEKGVKLLVLPELCVTGYTCGDLFFQPTLLDGAEKAVFRGSGRFHGQASFLAAESSAADGAGHPCYSHFAQMSGQYPTVASLPLRTMGVTNNSGCSSSFSSRASGVI